MHPVLSFDSDASQTYWTPKRLKTSESLQYHVYELAKRMFNSFNCSSALDIGCGPGLKMRNFFLHEIKTKKKNVALIDQPSVKGIVSKTFPEASFYDANLEDGTFTIGKKFDLIICCDVIEHLEHPDSIISIIKTHLNKDGILVISTPDRDMRRGKDNNRSPNQDHVREWNYEEFARYISHHNFDILKHVNLPSFRLNSVQMILHRVFYKKMNKTTWYPCQTIVARLRT